MVHTEQVKETLALPLKSGKEKELLKKKENVHHTKLLTLQKFTYLRRYLP
jgi:hypothetical protein